MISDLLSSVALDGGKEFNDISSYQSRARAWLERQEGVYMYEMSFTNRLIQRYALACFYFATNGVSNQVTDYFFGETVPNWVDTTNWISSEHECDWYGIYCEVETVTGIGMYNNGLTGKVPPEVALLSESLTFFDVYGNMVHNSGDEETHFLGELTNLRYLLLGQTYFEYDGIPESIGHLKYLEEFDCSYSLFGGSFQGSVFENKPNLRFLVLSGLSLGSPVPREIGELPSLEEFYIDSSDLTGDLSFIESMTESSPIRKMWLDYNPGLSGTIPEAIGRLINLQSFSLVESSLSGNIPPEIGMAQSLEEIWLYSNNLSGPVPDEIGNLLYLHTFEIDSNDITGVMPNDVCDLTVYGWLSTLAADCDEVACPCCTSCYSALSEKSEIFGGNGDTGASLEGNMMDSMKFGNAAHGSD